MWIYVLLPLAVLLILWFIPLQLRLQYEQMDWNVKILWELRTPLVRWRQKRDLSEGAAEALMSVCSNWGGEQSSESAPPQEQAAREALMSVVGVMGQPLRYLGRHTKCVRLKFSAQLGGYDAMQSALLVGSAWSLAGLALATLSRLLRLSADQPNIQILPLFSGPACRVAGDCILRLRLGDATVAGIWLLRRTWGRPQLRTWIRDAWRRKGEESSGRTSDSRPDEDGYGQH